MSSVVFVRFFPKAGDEARVESILRGMVVKTRQEPGCRRYDFYRASSGPSAILFCLIESYVDENAMHFHRETPHYKEYRASIANLLAQPIEVTQLSPLDAQ